MWFITPILLRWKYSQFWAFHSIFSPDALQLMADDIRTVPTLKAVNLSSEFNRKAMRDLIGAEAAKALS